MRHASDRATAIIKREAVGQASGCEQAVVSFAPIFDHTLGKAGSQPCAVVFDVAVVAVGR